MLVDNQFRVDIDFDLSFANVPKSDQQSYDANKIVDRSMMTVLVPYRRRSNDAHVNVHIRVHQS